MQVQVCSDLHLEVWRGTSWPRKLVWELMIKPAAPYLALVGDITTPGIFRIVGAESDVDNLAAFLRWLSRRFVRVFFVIGNHELFSKSRRYPSLPGQSASAILKTISDICDSIPGVELLNRRSVVVDNVRVIGATLWSDIDVDSQPIVALVENSIGDYHRIFVEKDDGELRLLKVSDTVEWHRQDAAFIQEELYEAERLGQRSLVLTHHAPWRAGTCKPEFANSQLNCAFASDIRFLDIGTVHTAWVHGHTHWNSRQIIGGSVLVSNQLGYKRRTECDIEDCGLAYEPDYVISI
ncbi:unnamed protein product (mitochondrion) [Plasmodiophora brassicae]|uniref:Calcineurin-like phosphoesterase domain-containing protein n=1 Tax=Plasmodiophora brassicae TaxID=37360 RepID=A0A0G4J289_PLABS|nr:hypothetical protein PBRA_002095 [Plasmodiophora brassicae]SPQ93231.1 unnamed protein product [Plasmodiophora brassicae]